MNFQDIRIAIDEGGVIASLFAVGLTLVLTLLLRTSLTAMVPLFQRLTGKTKTGWDDYFPVLVQSTRSWVLAIWIFSAVSRALVLGPNVDAMMRILVVLATTYQVIVWVIKAVRQWRDRKLLTLAQTTDAQAPIGLLTTVAETILVIIFLMVGLSNLGVDIGALIAGLGIGGIAVALAAQNILGDLFASFSIIFDKPFAIGDFIQVGDDRGSVQNIGLKTTRVKSLTGEQLIFSNKDLLESRIRNHKRMHERRVAHKIRIPFHTPVEKVKNLPRAIESILANEDKIRLDFCKMTEIGEFAFVFDCVYWVLTPDNNLHLEIQQRFFFELMTYMKTQKISFAVPAQLQVLSEVDKEALFMANAAPTPEGAVDQGRMGQN